MVRQGQGDGGLVGAPTDAAAWAGKSVSGRCLGCWERKLSSSVHLGHACQRMSVSRSVRTDQVGSVGQYVREVRKGGGGKAWGRSAALPTSSCSKTAKRGSGGALSCIVFFEGVGQAAGRKILPPPRHAPMWGCWRWRISAANWARPCAASCSMQRVGSSTPATLVSATAAGG